ncbi:MAG TPA: GFA family protein [Solirubrobacteraceae bacterium]
MDRRQAECSCGALRVIVAGDPVRISICHCLACQRRTGSAFGFQARFRREGSEIAGSSREFVRVSDDGETRRFHFCPECGTTVYYLDDSSPELIAVAVGAFGDPSFPAPNFSVWESRKHAWVAAPADVEHER